MRCTRLLPALLPIVLLAPACMVGDPNPNPGGDDDVGSPDAGGAQPDGGAAASCAAPDSYGAMGPLGAVSATQSNQPGSQGTRQIYTMAGDLESSPEDVLHIELWDQYGVFSGVPAAPGTYTISGAETSLDTCGVCVIVGGDIVDGLASQVFLAQSGTVQIDAITPTLSGSVTDMTFVQIDPDTGLPVADACTTGVQSGSFSATLVVTDPPAGN